MINIDANMKEKILIDGSLKDYLIFLNNEEVNLKYEIKYSCNIIIISKRSDIRLTDEGYIDEDQNVNITYIDLEKGNYYQDSSVVVRKGSILNVTSKYLSLDNKTINLNYINADRDSKINIDNSCICLDKSQMILNCTGKINRGSKASKNHQSSRCLTIDSPKKALIKPILLIDENDVEASHSLSSGTIDEDVLFYLYSRGITYHEAMILFINSYLLPQDNIFDNFENKDEIMNYLNDKVVNIYA